jgi:hypothetical protein
MSERFEFLIVGDIDVFDNWNEIMIPNSMDCQIINRDKLVILCLMQKCLWRKQGSL